MRSYVPILVFFLIAGTKSQCCAARISELFPDPSGRDPAQQLIELSGIAGMDFTGFILGIGGEASRIGLVDVVAPISGTFDSQGLLLAEIDDLFNPTHTIALVNGFTGTARETDIDTNDDGIADNVSSFLSVQDAIGVPGSAGGAARVYGSQLGGQDFAFTGDSPRLIFRDASVGEWYALNDPDGGQIFNVDGMSVGDPLIFSGDPFSESFGFINPSVAAIPEPATSVGMLVTFGIAMLARQRQRRVSDYINKGADPLGPGKNQ